MHKNSLPYIVLSSLKETWHDGTHWTFGWYMMQMLEGGKLCVCLSGFHKATARHICWSAWKRLAWHVYPLFTVIKNPVLRTWCRKLLPGYVACFEAITHELIIDRPERLATRSRFIDEGILNREHEILWPSFTVQVSQLVQKIDGSEYKTNCSLCAASHSTIEMCVCR